MSAAVSHAGLLANPGFESGNGSQPSDWTCFGNAWQSTNHARSGSYSLKLYGNGPGTASGVYQTLPARPGQRWTLSGYGLNASEDALAGQNYALMKIVWFSGPNATGKTLQPLPGPGALFGANPGIKTAQITNGTPADVWQFLSASGEAPPGTMSVQLLGGLFIQPANDAGAAWFDDLKASATPVWGHALSFDGLDDYVKVPAIWFSNTFTLEAWVYVRSHTNWARVLDFGNGIPMDNVLLALSDGTSGRPAFQAYDGTTWQGITAPDPIPLRQWVHLVATLSNNVAVLYVNGVPVASADNWTPLTPLWRTNNYIARSAWSWDGYADAVFDDLRIWSVARSAGEIQASLGYPLTGTELGLIAYAKCDDGSGTNLFDPVSQQSGDLVNGPEWTPSTVPLWGNALAFDGVDGHVVVANFGSAVPTNEVTVEFWLRVSKSMNQAFCIEPDALANRFSAIVPWSDGVVYWDFGNYSAGGRLAYTPPQGWTNSWQHFAFVAKAGPAPNGFMAIYRNGVLEANHAGAGSPCFGAQNLRLGGLTAGSFLGGELDEFRIWNKARTQAEIAADMLHPLTGNEPNLAAYWSFDDASTNVIRDGTPNYHDGLLTNGTTRVSSIISAPNLALNPGFEQGTGGWWPFGTTTLNNSSLSPHSGTNCVRVTNRTEAWQGVQQQFEKILQPELNYSISGWVRQDDAASQPVYLTMLKTDSSGTSYTGVAGGTATSNAWTRLIGSYTPSVSGTLTNLWLYLSGPDSCVNFYADDFVVAPDMAYAPLPLAATTLPASGMINSNATLNGIAQPGGLPATAWFEWGTDWNYDHASTPVEIGSGWDDLSVSNALTGLIPGLLYHYRLVASNRLAVVHGAYQHFWLPALSLNGPNPLTNECHAPFIDPGAGAGVPPAIAAGGLHSLALKADGSVVGWGAGTFVADPEDGVNYGQVMIPASASNVVAIAAGAFHSLGLKTDGSVVGWGAGGPGQLGILPHLGQTTIPASATNGVVAIAAGAIHSLALKVDGSVIGWGDNSYGQATIPAGASSGVVIAAGGLHSLALKADGSVVGWGDNGNGQTNVPPSATNVVAIAAGDYHSLALRADGSVVGWGDNSDGQTNVPPSATNGVVAIAAGWHHSLALKADGSVVGWGAGTNNTGINLQYGQAMIPAGLNTLNLPLTVSGTVDTNTPGSYELTYSVTNALGAVATTNRTVVVVDTLPPILTLLGENPLMVEVGAPFADPGATASDQCGGDLTGSVVSNITVNSSVPGIYTNTFAVTDAYSNLATTNRLVVVVTRPVLTGLEQLDGGTFRFTFTNTPGAQFNVLATTNVALPLSEWTVVGPVVEDLPGEFLFTDSTATNYPTRYYRLRWP